MATIMNGAQFGAHPPAKRWVIRFVLPKGDSVLYGMTGSSKSFAALEMAGSISTGKDFVGKYPVTPGIVVYITLEGDIDPRWHLFRKQNNLLLSDEERERL